MTGLRVPEMVGPVSPLMIPSRCQREMPVFCVCGTVYPYEPGAVCPRCSVSAKSGMLMAADRLTLFGHRCHTCGEASEMSPCDTCLKREAL